MTDDIWCFHTQFMRIVDGDQAISDKGLMNEMAYQPLDGFLLTVWQFPFTSIAGNRPAATALMRDTGGDQSGLRIRVRDRPSQSG